MRPTICVVQNSNMKWSNRYSNLTVKLSFARNQENRGQWLKREQVAECYTTRSLMCNVKTSFLLDF